VDSAFISSKVVSAAKKLVRSTNSMIAGVALTLFGAISIAMSYMFPWQSYYGYPLIVIVLIVAGIVSIVPGLMLVTREWKEGGLVNERH
jgi:Na+/glutamate symporter